MKIIFIFFICFVAVCVSCAPQPQNSEVIPKNVATKAEEDQIDSTLTEIEKISEDLGSPRMFRNLPIYVTDEDSSVTNRVGYCSSIGYGQTGYIVINRSVFDLNANNGRFNYLFGVLLHEIGHCYFNREHENSEIQKNGFRFEIEATDSSGGVDVYLEAIPVSIMYVKNDAPSDLVKVPTNFKRYFVGELLGISRLKTATDLEEIPGVRFIPKFEANSNWSLKMCML